MASPSTADPQQSPGEPGWLIFLKVITFIAIPTGLVFLIKMLVG